MIIAYKYKLRVSSSQEIIMTNWLLMLRSHYNFCLRDRIEAYEQVKSPKLGNYSDLKTKAAKRALNRLIRDFSWGNLKLKI